MKKILSGVMLFLVCLKIGYAEYNGMYGPITDFDRKVLSLGSEACYDIQEDDIPTIFIPGILASWYSEEGYGEAKTKRWIPDPITHVYDTLFYTFKSNGYSIKDVFYSSEFRTYIKGDPKKSLYLFGYDWKKDNKVSATLLNNLAQQIEDRYYQVHKCYIGKVNIIAHSMGGLVARSLLEDMCVRDDDIMHYNNREGLKMGQIKNFNSTKCTTKVKVNKFITISTPHRGSPKSLALWEKGDMEMVDDFWISLVLKGQLDTVFDTGLYKVIHGYEPDLPNGIVSLGQLLPDIKNKNTHNEKLKYILKDGRYLDNKNYPQNSFLEELNKEENINKIWNKIEKNYTSYYSTQTGNAAKNNLTNYDLKNTTTLYQTSNGYTYKPNDQTELYTGKDIYDVYKSFPSINIYNIKNTIRNENGLGGDGTVPTNNLYLIPNDSETGKVIKNDKFEEIEIQCYPDSGIVLNPTIDVTKKEAHLVYQKLGENAAYEICSHINMPIATSIKVFENISNIKISSDNFGNPIPKNERKKLLSYLGHANYTEYDYEYLFGTTTSGGIHNNTTLDDFFIKGPYLNSYKTELDEKDLQIEYNRLDFTPTKEPEWVSLDFAGTAGKMVRVVTYDVRSPINLEIENEAGQKIGINPETGHIENTIPGAWTSGDTEGSGEPEFFMIPISGTGSINHKIKTYGTGDGEYHIVMNQVGMETGDIKEKIIIQGNAKENFGEDYVVKIDDNTTAFVNLTAKIPPTLEINDTNIITFDDTYTIRYTIRGKSDEISQIKYKVFKDNISLEDTVSKINGKFDVDISDAGKYSIVVGLYDTDGDILKNSEAKKVLNIFKKDQKLQIELEGKYKEKLEKIKKKIQTSFTQKQKNNLKKMIEDYQTNKLYNGMDTRLQQKLEYIFGELLSVL